LKALKISFKNELFESFLELSKSSFKDFQKAFLKFNLNKSKKSTKSL
jgi:hypothetical protein